MKKRNLMKIQVLLLSAFLAAGSLLSGCGGRSEEPEPQQTSSQEAVMGRYLETELSLPQEELMVQAVTQLEDGTLRGAFSDTMGSYGIYDTGDDGKSWRESVELGTLLELNENRSIQKIALSRQGDIYASVVETSQENSEDYQFKHYLVNKEGTVSVLELGTSTDYTHAWQALFAKDGTLYVEILGNGVYEFVPGKTDVEKVFEEGSNVEGMGVVGNTLLLFVNFSVHYYDRETKAPAQDEKALTEQLMTKKENMEVTTSSSYPTLFLESAQEDKLFYVNSDGVFCYQPGGAIVEQVIDGDLTSLKAPDNGLVDGICLNDGGFLLGIYNNSKGKLFKYSYSKDTSARPEIELTVYSMGDNSLLKKAAALYQQENPNVLVQLQVGLTGEDALTPADAQKNLNTQIMADKGPDILLMDRLFAQPYLEKGLLEDVSQVLSECSILENIKAAYETEDGKIYMMPTGFGIPIKFARSKDLGRIGDLVSLADYLEELALEESSREFYRGPYSWAVSAQILGRRLAPLYTGSWIKEDGTVDKDKVRDFLEQTGRIYETASHEDEGQMMIPQEELYEDVTNSYILSLHSQGIYNGYGLIDCGVVMSPYGYVEVSTAAGYMPDYDFGLWDLDSGFIPINVTAINHKTEHMEEAKDFYKFLFSDTVQQLTGRKGISVNQKVYEDLKYWGYGTHEYDKEEFTSSDTRTGESTFFAYVQPGQEEISRIQELGRKLTRRMDHDQIVCDAAVKGLEDYVHGELTLEEATDKIMKEVNLYLAE